MGRFMPVVQWAAAWRTRTLGGICFSAGAREAVIVALSPDRSVVRESLLAERRERVG